MLSYLPLSPNRAAGAIGREPAPIAWMLGVPALIIAVCLPAPLATLLLIAPVLEEVVFRIGLQEALERRLHPRAGAAGIANVLTACAFAAAHLAVQPGVLAGLTLIPALWVGQVYRRQRRLAPCIALHIFFNAIWLLGSTSLGPASTSFL